MKRASVDFRQGRLAVGQDDQTVNGMWQGADPAFVDDATDPVAVGQAVMRALAASRRGIPHPSWDELNSSSDPVRDLFGIKSMSMFMNFAKHVAVSQESQHYTVTPYANKGARGGFTALDKKARVLVQPSEAELGQAVLDALNETE